MRLPLVQHALVLASPTDCDERHFLGAVAALTRHKSLNVAQKYAKQADQLRRAPSKNPALAI